MAPRESFDISVEPFGDFLETVIAIYGPSGIRISITDGVSDSYSASSTVSESPAIDSGILSARGSYKIRVTNTAIIVDDLATDAGYLGGVGLYTLSIGCTTSNGTKIKPGDISQPTLPTPTEQADAQTSTPQGPAAEAPLSFLEIGQTYEIAFGSQTKTELNLVTRQFEGIGQ